MAKPVGRPKGDVETEMLAVRIPVDLGQQLNRHLDRLETRTGIRANRASIARHALKLFLDAQDREYEQPRQEPQRSATPARDNTRQPISLSSRNQIAQSESEPGLTFDATKHILGKLCPQGHSYGTTGQSLLQRSNRKCLLCHREQGRKRRQANGQTQL